MALSTRKLFVLWQRHRGGVLALSARVLDDLGFEVIYVTGAGVTNTRRGLPHQGYQRLGASPCWMRS